jgi:bifunctional enzyme CysN/CysC
MNRRTTSDKSLFEVDWGVPPAREVQAQRVDFDKAMRAAMKGQHPAVVWFTGLSGTGERTVANLV